MLDILLYVVMALIAAIVVLLLVASRRPDHFHSARSLRMAAPPERLFGLIENLREMNRWNPYALRETGGKAEYSGPERGKGARFDFAGSKSGSGYIEVLDSAAPSNVVMRLMMVKPFRADNRIEFTVAPAGGGSDVTWAMSGRQPLLMKAMSLIINCDKMVGRDFEEGLANLKAIAEKP